MISDKKHLRRNLLIVGTIVFLILLFDQLLKIYIKSTFSPDETRPILGDWFVLHYTENPGMAFGTTFGVKVWHKLALSIFRVVAVIALCYYWFTQWKKSVRVEFLVALGLIIAGATGNLLDSMLYDYIFEFDPCAYVNQREGSGIFTDCPFYGDKWETRPHGFLMGNVVDMFKLDATWPEWMPWLANKSVFPAIWNVADTSITLGVIMIFIRQRKYFPKTKKEEKSETTEEITEDTALEEKPSEE